MATCWGSSLGLYISRSVPSLHPSCSLLWSHTTTFRPASLSSRHSQCWGAFSIPSLAPLPTPSAPWRSAEDVFTLSLLVLSCWAVPCHVTVPSQALPHRWPQDQDLALESIFPALGGVSCSVGPIGQPRVLTQSSGAAADDLKGLPPSPLRYESEGQWF